MRIKFCPLLLECTVEPHFLGFPDNLISLGYLSEAVDEFGWEKAFELVFNLGAKLVGARAWRATTLSPRRHRDHERKTE